MTDTAQHKARLRAYFDGVGFERWSAIYGGGALASRVRRSIRAGHSAMLAQAARWLNELPHAAGERALDAGCGTGLWSLELARRGYAVRAADIAPQMVGATLEQARASGLAERVTGEVADLEALGGSYELVSCFDVLIHYPAASARDMLLHLASLSRGRLLLTYAPRQPLLVALHWVGARFPQGQRHTNITMLPDAFVRQSLAEAGFGTVRTHRISSGFYHVTLVEAQRI